MLPTESSSLLSLDPSPSFNTYSSTTLAQIAARVVQEFTADRSEVNDDDIFGFKPENESVVDKPHEQVQTEDEGGDDDDDFEFALAFGERDSSLISADDIFCNGQIRPVFPLFNTDLLLENAELEESNTKPPVPRPARQPLRKLFIEERDSPSCSSSEADELDGIQPETYCVWKPRVPPEGESLGRRKKSNSTGSSKRWKFRDLLHRSNSDGKDSFVFLAPSKVSVEKADDRVLDKSSKDTGSVKEVVAEGLNDTSVTAANHVRNRGTKEGDRGQSFLPYKQDLVGLFTNVSGLSRKMHPF